MRTTGTYVALIRGINVGRAKRVSMAGLRALLEELGYDEVRTVLNSGNVVFVSTAAAARGAARRIQGSLESKLGVQARVVVLGAVDISTIVSENPLLDTATNPSRLMVMVLFDPSDRRRLTSLTSQDWAPEALGIGSRAAYVWCPDGIRDSRLSKAVGRIVGDGVTARNWATMQKLHQLVHQ